MDLLKLARVIFFILVFGFVACVIYFPNYTKVKRLKEENQRLNQANDGLIDEISGLKKNLERVEKDPFFWEELARENVGVIREGEIVVDINKEE